MNANVGNIIHQIKLAVDEIYPGYSPRSVTYRWGTMAFALFQSGRISRWLDRNRNNPILLEELRCSPKVFGSMLRPYVNRKWIFKKRLAALEQHYLAIGEKGSLFVFNDDQYIDLVRLGPEYFNLRVVIDKPGWMRSEGEIAVSLFCQNHRIYTVMFLVTGDSENRRLAVGAIQGCGRQHARNLYVELTHALHGLRPRDLLICVLKIIANNLGCSEILGVSDACHRSANLFSSAAKEAAYDAVWQEYGGTLNSEGFLVISTEMREREPGDIPSRKRAQYRRRYELIHEIQRRIDKSFATGERVLMNHVDCD